MGKGKRNTLVWRSSMVIATLVAVAFLGKLSKNNNLKRTQRAISTVQKQTQKAIVYTKEGIQETFNPSKSKGVERPASSFTSRVFQARNPTWTDGVTLIFLSALAATFVLGLLAVGHYWRVSSGNSNNGNYQKNVFKEPLKYVGIVTLGLFVVRCFFIIITYYPTYGLRWAADEICFGFLSFALGWE